MPPESRLRLHPELLRRARELRRPLTPAEQRLWLTLRNRHLEGFKFRRQHSIGRFIADFCCPWLKLVVEIDGQVHAGQVEYDRARTAWLESRGYTVIRFPNEAVLHDRDAVAGQILAACRRLEKRGEPHD